MDRQQPARRNPPRDDSQPRKPYRAPQLVEYGNLHKITLAKGGMMNDGSLPSTRK